MSRSLLHSAAAVDHVIAVCLACPWRFVPNSAHQALKYRQAATDAHLGPRGRLSCQRCGIAGTGWKRIVVGMFGVAWACLDAIAAGTLGQRAGSTVIRAGDLACSYIPVELLFRRPGPRLLWRPCPSARAKTDLVGVRLAACLAVGLLSRLLSAATAILSGHEWMHSSGPGPSNRQRSRGLPGMQQPKVRALLVAATLLPVVGLHPAQRQRGCSEQRG